ncbi:MAG: hypothetical protein NDI60_04580 [Elusimicrobiales bacterium]|nr:hypothetical protein [Elusimicrobiales bacterium]
MKHLLLAAAFSAFFTASASAAWWLENDYASGSNGLKKDSFAVFTKLTPRLVLGANTAFYRDSAAYRDKTWSFRLPLMYSGETLSVSLKPFIYPVASGSRSGASGAKVFLLTSVSEGDDESYLRATVSGAWAAQKSRVLENAVPGRKNFSQSAFEVQVEKSYFSQFYFLASAAAFTKPSGVSNATLVTPAMDQSELAYLGTFRQITALPDWAMTAQVARNMRPEFDSHIYAGYSKISFRRAGAANSGIAGIKLGLNERSMLDLGYNLYKEEGAAWKNYYKIGLQVFF